ncbi:PH domain-containing protein [Stomatohabitans albus]|uniref:PH domain-containing protein n=1 Tax=Stomatohabitans albus TaxID=3110766 RepID=UPI00300C9AF8
MVDALPTYAENGQVPEGEWKRLGVGNLILSLGQHVLSLIMTIVLLIIANIVVVNIQTNLTNLPVDPAIIPQVIKWIFGVFIVLELLAIAWAFFTHRAIRYRLAPDAVIKKGGVYTTYTHTIPGLRVQGVEITANPFQRFLGVSSVTITTAGVHSPNMTIHNLANADAYAIQNQLGVDRDYA